MKEGYLYDRQKQNFVKCKACSHCCLIGEGKTGICGVRKNIKGTLYSLVYGKAVGLHVDPIEKKPLFHFLPSTAVLSFGTVGCNFRCSFCQNYEMSQAPRELGEEGIFGEVLSPKEIVDICIENKIPSIAYTYNEPAVFIEYAYDTAKLAHENSIKNIYVTNGYETQEALEMMKPYIDTMNIDIKGFTEDFYNKICGARLQPVLDTIKKAKEMGFWIELTTLVIPKTNDSEKELKGIAEFISSIDKNIPWHISRFFPMYKMLTLLPTPENTLLKAYEIGKKAGLNYVYVGNILTGGSSPADNKENTFCPSCNELLVERVGFEIKQNKLIKGSCPKCKTRIAGIF